MRCTTEWSSINRVSSCVNAVLFSFMRRSKTNEFEDKILYLNDLQEISAS